MNHQPDPDAFDRDVFDALMADVDPVMIIVTTASDGVRAGCLVGFHTQCGIDPVEYAVWLSKANHTYDLAMQYDVMSLVAEATDVPVPETLWYEADGSIIGAPFFVMRRVDGIVPRDVMPYTFGDNWVYDASPEQLWTLTHSTAEVLEQLSGMSVDAPLCLTCGTKMRRSGSCYICEGCGSTSGCS